LGERLGKAIQHELDLLPQLLALHFKGVLLEDGGGRVQHAIDLIHIAGGEAGYLTSDIHGLL